MPAPSVAVVTCIWPFGTALSSAWPEDRALTLPAVDRCAEALHRYRPSPVSTSMRRLVLHCCEFAEGPGCDPDWSAPLTVQSVVSRQASGLSQMASPPPGSETDLIPVAVTKVHASNVGLGDTSILVPLPNSIRSAPPASSAVAVTMRWCSTRESSSPAALKSPGLRDTSALSASRRRKADPILNSAPISVRSVIA